MSATSALLAQQPVAFWLAVVGVLAAAALASGSRTALRAALAAGLGALVAAVAPAAVVAQALAGVAGVAVAAFVGWRRRPRAEPLALAVARGGDDARLLGRTARTRAPFVGGDGEVEVDGAVRPARTLTPDEFLGDDVLVRIVRVGEPALVVRPVSALAG